MHFMCFYMLYPGELVTHMEEWEIRSVYSRLGDRIIQARWYRCMSSLDAALPCAKFLYSLCLDLICKHQFDESRIYMTYSRCDIQMNPEIADQS